MKGKHLVQVCEECLDDIDGFEPHMTEAFEISGKFLCETCWLDFIEAAVNAELGVQQ